MQARERQKTPWEVSSFAADGCLPASTVDQRCMLMVGGRWPVSGECHRDDLNLSILAVGDCVRLGSELLSLNCEGNLSFLEEAPKRTHTGMRSLDVDCHVPCV